MPSSRIYSSEGTVRGKELSTLPNLGNHLQARWNGVQDVPIMLSRGDLTLTYFRGAKMKRKGPGNVVLVSIFWKKNVSVLFHIPGLISGEEVADQPR